MKAFRFLFTLMFAAVLSAGLQASTPDLKENSETAFEVDVGLNADKVEKSVINLVQGIGEVTLSIEKESVFRETELTVFTNKTGVFLTQQVSNYNKSGDVVKQETPTKDFCIKPDKEKSRKPRDGLRHSTTSDFQN